MYSILRLRWKPNSQSRLAGAGQPSGDEKTSHNEKEPAEANGPDH